MSELARKVRTDSTERGRRVVCSRANHNTYRTTQIQMAWITQRALQDDQRRYPGVQSAFPLLDSWERAATDNPSVYNHYLQDLWNEHPAI
eukprot:4836533-Prorocentrum_lima.AAC.1